MLMKTFIDMNNYTIDYEKNVKIVEEVNPN